MNSCIQWFETLTWYSMVTSFEPLFALQPERRTAAEKPPHQHKQRRRTDDKAQEGENAMYSMSIALFSHRKTPFGAAQCSASAFALQRALGPALGPVCQAISVATHPLHFTSVRDQCVTAARG